MTIAPNWQSSLPTRISMNVTLPRTTPKSGFGDKLAAGSDLLASLDRVHQRIRACRSASLLAGLLDEYVVLTARLAGTYSVAAPFVPGGSILSAAISSVGGSTGFAGAYASTAG